MKVLIIFQRVNLYLSLDESNYFVDFKIKDYDDPEDSNLQVDVGVTGLNKEELKMSKRSSKTSSHKSKKSSETSSRKKSSNTSSRKKSKSSKSSTSKDKSSEKSMGYHKGKGYESSDDSEKDSHDLENSIKIEKLIPKVDFDDINEYYVYLRSKYNSDNLFEDHEFPPDKMFFAKDGDLAEKFEEVIFQKLDIQGEDIKFFECDLSTNIDYDFKIKRGIMSDRSFLSSVLLLFRKKEEYFSNLVLDIENVEANIRAGFCGFTFFINGEWKNVTVDTRIPFHQNDDMSLSVATSNKNSLWLCLFAKAYAKIFKTYDVLNYCSIKNTLVELTGGVSKKILLKEKLDEQEKKNIFDEIKRYLSQKHLLGCMKYDENDEDVSLFFLFR
jgi:hypothetical protein